MRRSGRLCAQIRDMLAAFIQPGMTTADVDQHAARLIADAGAKSAFLGYRGYPGHLCISLNEEVVHGIGSPRRIIKIGDLVKLDVGIIYQGWLGDTAITLPIGPIPHDWQRLIQITEESLARGIAEARDGSRVGQISHAIQKYVESHGFSVVREFVGHGLGRQLHEEPQVPNFGRPKDGPRLKPGMVICIEPMVNMGGPNVKILSDKWTAVTVDGLPSAHVEHTVLITEGEPEILTNSAVVPHTQTAPAIPPDAENNSPVGAVTHVLSPAARAL